MKRTVILAALIISATALILYGLWAARPVAEVYVAQRGTATSAVYGTVKVVASVTMNTRARESGIIHPAAAHRLAGACSGVPVFGGLCFG